MATVTFPTIGTYTTPGIFNNFSSSTFLNDATLTTVVFGWIHSVGNLYALVGTPVTTTEDYTVSRSAPSVYVAMEGNLVLQPKVKQEA